jgi:hypothetical protein
LLAFIVSGCSMLDYRDAIEDLREFRPLATAPQVRYAAGAEPFARRVAELLPEAVARVEAVHGRAFALPPVVYVCNDPACFDRFVDPRSNYTAAVLYDNRLLLAPRLFDREPQRLVPILLHELSHLHLGQRRGHYSTSIPVWFHEGLASLVAAGGGADLATDEEVWSSVAAQRHFLPDEQHLPWQRRMASSWNLPVSLFYRQAFLFLRDLRARDADGFRRLLALLQDGSEFDAAFAQAYYMNPARAAGAFFQSRGCTLAGAVQACRRDPACCPATASGHGER